MARRPDRGAGRRELGVTPLRRVGQPPKRLLVYRAAGEPFRKAQTPELWKGDLKAKVEVLGHGQQFVAFGIHPDTGQPYAWDGPTPETMPLAELPAVTQEQVAAFVAEAERRLRAAGYRTKAEIEAEPHRPRRRNRGRDRPDPGRTATPDGRARARSRRSTTRRCGGLEAWVRELFPRAKRQAGTGAWRVSSRDLGRELEEDLSIAPCGIVDFGIHDQGDPRAGQAHADRPGDGARRRRRTRGRPRGGWPTGSG